MEGTITPSEAIALSGANRGYGNSGLGFGGDGAWIVLLLLLAWGNNGNGFGFGGGNGGVNPNYVINSDNAFLSRQIDSATASLERKGDFIQEQICTSDQMNASQFANINTNILTNAAGLNNTLATNFALVNQGISNNRYENAIAVGNAQNSLQSQIASCCCDARVQSLENTNALQTSLAGINYNMATNTNGITNAIDNGFCTSNYNAATNTRDLIDAINASARATQDMIMANRLEDKDARISALETQLNNANLRASQAAQTNSIVDQLRPTPVPSYIVQNPYCNCNGCGNYNF